MVPGLTVVVVVAGPPTGTLGTPADGFFVVVVVAPGAVVVVAPLPAGGAVVVVEPGSGSIEAVVVVAVEPTVWAAAEGVLAPMPAITVIAANRGATAGRSRRAADMGTI